jgi:threonine/homoserine/homoserine lactone efflux protein
VVSAAAAGGIGLVALGLVLTPGPNMIYLVSRSITQGRRAGLVSLLGVAVGFLAYLAAASAGLAAIFTAVPAAYTALKIAGALYLLYLAWQALRPGGVLGAIQIAVALTVNGLIVLTASTLSRFLGRRPTWLRIQRYVMAACSPRWPSGCC